MKYLLVLLVALAAFAQQNTIPVKVDVTADRVVTVTVPLDPAFHAFVIYGDIDGPDRYRNVFQKADLSGTEYRRVVALPPGKYVVMVGLRNLDGEGRHAFVPFTVK